MYITTDISLRDILQQVLQHVSPHTLLYTLADLERHVQPEEFADKALKLLEVGEDK
jgi:hypothetical protein